MKKPKAVFVCQECGASFSKWMGRCTSCDTWNSVVEEVSQPLSATLKVDNENVPKPINQIDITEVDRMETGISELDCVLGGGLVPGSLVLLGGEPGIGKSTILLQMAMEISQKQGEVLYVSGEESAAQVRLRAERLGAVSKDLWLLAENNLELVLHHAKKRKCKVLIVDSIQTVFMPELSSAPGSVTQVRGCGSELMHLAKDLGITVILVGHVTKEGTLAGPRVLEHMVDTVLSFEGDRVASLRMLRAIKNRFGSTNEIGVFEMRSNGLQPLNDPSGVFLTHREEAQAGASVGCVVQGTRPVLLEIQALCASSGFGNPRRLASGLDYNRLLIIVAVLEKKVGLNLTNQDIYVNVTGGLRVDDPSIDLAVAAAIASSYREMSLPKNLVVVGEVGLTGEVRQGGQTARRLNEIAKMGFGTVIAPKEKLLAAEAEKNDLKLYQVDNLHTALKYMGVL